MWLEKAALIIFQKAGVRAVFDFKSDKL